LDNRHFFKKTERICIQKEIELLFEQNASFIAYPLRVVYTLKSDYSGAPVSILISVPKKKFKRAVKRNRIKRLIRENYRLNKLSLLKQMEEKGGRLLIGFIFVGDEMCDFKCIEAAVLKALNSLKENTL
jgi:ribonuclease P protein component